MTMGKSLKTGLISSAVLVFIEVLVALVTLKKTNQKAGFSI
jgi:hypothetical protein